MSRSNKQRRSKSGSDTVVEHVNATLEAARPKFERGDYTVILDTLRVCLDFGVLPAPWLVTAFCDRVRHPEEYKTWDDAFGPPLPKGTKKARRQEMKNASALISKVRALRAQNIKGRDLWERAGAELGLGVGWETVRDAYYRQPKGIRLVSDRFHECFEALGQELSQKPTDGSFDFESFDMFGWMGNWFDAHPYQPSEKRARIKRKI